MLPKSYLDPSKEFWGSKPSVSPEEDKMSKERKRNWFMDLKHSGEPEMIICHMNLNTVASGVGKNNLSQYVDQVKRWRLGRSGTHRLALRLMIVKSYAILMRSPCLCWFVELWTTFLPYCSCSPPQAHTFSDAGSVAKPTAQRECWCLEPCRCHCIAGETPPY